jgi:tetratricopeptide (TPR) repeat protein
VLRLVPFLAMGSMFVWPQVLRLAAGRAVPQARVLTDAEGWGSFVTSDFWRNLPGPWIAALTFAICGLAMVYLLGTRAFCADVCPYGAVFSIADRLAPGRIVLLGGDCSKCGICTAVCQSHVRVHEELAAYSKVVSSACLKDLDCVGACPQGALGYGFTRPALLQSLKPGQSRLRRHDFTAAEEAAAAGTLLACALIFRGLYGAVPFLMSLGIAVIAAYLAVVCARLVRRPSVSLGRVGLKRGGRWTRGGRLFAAGACLFWAFTVHSAWVRYGEVCRHRALERFEQGALSAEAGRPVEAIEHLEAALALDPGLGPAHYNLGVVLERLGRTEEAAREYRSAVALDPGDAEARNNLGLLLLEQGALEAAEGHLRAAMAARPAYARPHFNLGRLLLLRGQSAEARTHFERAARLDRRYSPFLGPARGRAEP